MVKNFRVIEGYGDYGEFDIYNYYELSMLLIEELEINLYFKW